jgi:hypothetical protein
MDEPKWCDMERQLLHFQGLWLFVLTVCLFVSSSGCQALQRVHIYSIRDLWTSQSVNSNEVEDANLTWDDLLQQYSDDQTQQQPSIQHHEEKSIVIPK